MGLPLASFYFHSPGRHAPQLRLHLNMMTPSGRNEWYGCMLISTMRSVVSLRSRNEGYLMARSRYACRCDSTATRHGYSSVHP